MITEATTADVVDLLTEIRDLLAGLKGGDARLKRGDLISEGDHCGCQFCECSEGARAARQVLIQQLNRDLARLGISHAPQPASAQPDLSADSSTPSGGAR